MLVKSISFPTYLEDITDIENNNIDVFVELEDGYTYTVVVATVKNIESLMDKEKINFSEPGDPFIIVRKLTKEIIEETLKAYAESNDGYWLKLYHFAGKINKTVFNKLQAEHTEYLFHRNRAGLMIRTTGRTTHIIQMIFQRTRIKMKKKKKLVVYRMNYKIRPI
jgi:hypothetical protein